MTLVLAAGCSQAAFPAAGRPRGEFALAQLPAVLLCCGFAFVVLASPAGSRLAVHAKERSGWPPPARDGSRSAHAELRRAASRSWSCCVQARGVGRGSPPHVVLEGPGGSGKSALLQAFTAILEPGTVLAGSGVEEESLLRFGLLEPAPGKPRRHLGGPLRRRWPAARGARPPGPAVAGGAVDRRCPPRRPGVAGGDQLRVRRLHADPVLTVIATRDLESLPAGMLRLADSEDGVLRLSGLSADEVVDLATNRGHQTLSHPAAERLRRHTGGNPLHLRALLDELDDEALRRARRCLRRRRTGSSMLRSMAAQSAEARRLARALTVLPEGSTLTLAAAVAGVADPLPAAEALIRAGLLTCEFVEDTWLLSFAHPMLRAALLDDVGPVDRKQFHTRAAQVLSSGESLLHRVAAASGADSDLVEDLVEHAAQRQGSGEPEAAANLLLKAAHPHARRTAARADSARGRRTVSVVGDMGGARAVSDRLGDLPRTAHRLFLEARIAWFSGDPTAAEELAREAWEHDELTRAGRGSCAAILAQLHNLRGEGREAAEWADRALTGGPAAGPRRHHASGPSGGTGSRWQDARRPGLARRPARRPSGVRHRSGAPAPGSGRPARGR